MSQSKTFIVSDTHFGHNGVCVFEGANGGKLRPWDNPEAMDKDMVKMWNDIVRPQDKVYHLGDVVINRKALKTLEQLNGRKILIKGNHDIFKLNEYTPYFDDVRAYQVLNGCIMSHIPVHESQLQRFGTNIHGHLHDRRVLLPNGDIDVRYHCVCVEHTNYTPILLEDVYARIEAEGGSLGFKTQGNN